MSQPEASPSIDLANLAAAIERAAADLALAEEPSRFIAALDDAWDEHTESSLVDRRARRRPDGESEDKS